jgi:hypothetical protein
VSPSWDFEDHYGETDSPAARYQTAVDREFRTRMVEGWAAPDGWRRPTEPVCGKCSYVIVDGACVGCGPWAQPSLSERADGIATRQDNEPPKPRYDSADGRSNVLIKSRGARSERDAA